MRLSSIRKRMCYTTHTCLPSISRPPNSSNNNSIAAGKSVSCVTSEAEQGTKAAAAAATSDKQTLYGVEIGPGVNMSGPTTATTAATTTLSRRQHHRRLRRLRSNGGFPLFNHPPHLPLSFGPSSVALFLLLLGSGGDVTEGAKIFSLGQDCFGFAVSRLELIEICTRKQKREESSIYGLFLGFTLSPRPDAPGA